MAAVLAALVAASVLVGCTAPAPEPTAAPTVTVTPTPVSTRSAAPSPEPAPDPLPEGPVDVLLIGTDSRDPADLTGNADTIMLAHLTADRSTLYLVSLTRDMWVTIPGAGEGKINSAFSRGGTERLRSTVSALFGGLEIDHVAQANFAGFIALTRALDGFEVDNVHATTVTVQSTGRVVEFPAGRIRLDNTDGLIYVRQRKGLPLGDLDRAQRQRAAVVGMLEELGERLDEPAVLAELVTMLHRNVKITPEMPVDRAVAITAVLSDLDRDDVVGLQVPITGFGTVGGASVNLVDEARTAQLGEALRADDVASYVEQHGTGYAP